MKKFLFFILLVLSGCQNNKAREDVSLYMNNKYAQVGNIEIIEYSSIDSLYSPFNAFMSIILQYSELNLEVEKEYAKVADMKSLKAMREQLDKAISISDEELYSQFTNELYFIDNPDALSVPKNRLGVKAKFSFLGEENEAYFFYNTNEDTIGHSSLELKTKVKEITQMHLDFSMRQSEMARLKSDLY